MSKLTQVCTHKVSALLTQLYVISKVALRGWSNPRVFPASKAFYAERGVLLNT